MKSNIKYILGIIGVLLVIVFISIILFTGNNDKFNLFKNVHTANTGDYFSSAGDGVWINKDIINKDEVTLVAEKFKEYGLTGGIFYDNLDKLGEGDVPEWIDKNSYYEWYTISTDKGMFYAIVNNDVVYTNYEEATTNEAITD